MPDYSKISRPGLIPIKIENQGTLLTTQVNKINFTGSGVTASIGEFNDLTILITGGGGSNISSSYALSASFASTASYFSGSISNAISASYALTASYFSGSISNAISASYALSSSNALTASYALNASSFPYSGSAQITGSLGVTGSITATSFTGSLLGTGSWAVSASQAITSSFTINAISASYALSSSFATTASYAYSASYEIIKEESSSFADTASYVNPLSQSVLITGSLALTGSLSIYKSGSIIVDVQGSSGQLFSITDSLTGSLFSVNTVAGLPVMEAFSNYDVNIGKYGAYPFKITGSGTSVIATGSFTGSFTGIMTGTASFASTASLALNSLLLNNTASSIFATTGSNNFRGDQNISGSTNITGSFSVSGVNPTINLAASVIDLTSPLIRAGLLNTSTPPTPGIGLNTILIDALNGTLYVTSSLPGGGGGTGLADRIQTGSITASVADGSNPSFPYFFLLQSSSRDLLKFNTEGVMALEAYYTTPTPITGGIYFSASGEFFFGI